MYHVNINDGDDTNDGLKWSTAFKNIQPAINAAEKGDTIKIAEGTYHPTQKIAEVYGGSTHPTTPTGDRHRSFLLKKDIKLFGGFPSNVTDAATMDIRDWKRYQTILSGDFNEDDGDNFENTDENALHVVVMLNATPGMTLDGISIMGGGGTDSLNVFIDGIPVDHECGGGIYAFSDILSSPVISNVVIKNNKVEGDGGGFFNYSNGIASPELIKVTMLNNVAKIRGGAIYNDGRTTSSPKLLNVNITGNEAMEGGGFVCLTEVNDCAPELENVLISGNKAKKSAGAYIFAMETNACPILTNTTICGNKATDNGGIGGLLVLATGEANPSIRNSVIWGNKSYNRKSDNMDVRSQTGAKNPVYTYSFIESMDLGETNLDKDTEPMFVNPVDADFAPTVSDLGDYQLLAESPLINKGNNLYLTRSEDLAGKTRITGETVDIGAYEFQDDPSDNAVIGTEKIIWSHQGILYLRIEKNTATVRIYSVNGTLVKQIDHLSEGTYTLPLPNGLYFITPDTGETVKVLIK